MACWELANNRQVPSRSILVSVLMSSETDRSNRQRPLRRYSLRTLLVVLTLVSIWMGWFFNAVRQQQKTVAKIQELGGTVHYDFQVNSIGELLDDPEPPEPAWIRNLGVDYVATVASVNLENARIRDVDFLSGLTGLRTLDLDRTNVDNLAPLSGLKDLKVLILDNTQVQDLGPLQNLGELQRLSIRNTSVSDLTALSTLRQLQSLHAQNVPISDVRPLANLKSLDLLVLDRTEVEDISALSNLMKLCWLSLDGTNVQDLSPLLDLKNLERIDIKETSVSSDQVAKFEAAVPNCHVDRVRISYEELRQSLLD